MGKYIAGIPRLEPVPIDINEPSDITRYIYTVRKRQWSQDPRDRLVGHEIKVYIDSGLRVWDAEIDRLAPLYEQFHGVISVSVIEEIERNGGYDISTIKRDKIFYPQDFYQKHMYDHVREGQYDGEYDNSIRSLDMLKGKRPLSRVVREGAPLSEEEKRLADLFVLTPAKEDRRHRGLIEINCLVMEINVKTRR